MMIPDPLYNTENLFHLKEKLYPHPDFFTVHIYRRGKAELFSAENRKSPRTLPPAQRSSQGRADGIRIIFSSEAGSGCSRSNILLTAINVPASLDD